VRLHLHFTRKAAAAEAQKLKKQAVWVRMHLQGRRGRERVVLSLRATPYPSERSGASGRWSLLFPLRIGLGRMGGALYLKIQRGEHKKSPNSLSSQIP